MIRETKILIVIIASICMSMILVSLAGAKGAGSSSGITLTQPVSARSAGIAEAYTALSGDAASFTITRAGFCRLRARKSLLCIRAVSMRIILQALFMG